MASTDGEFVVVRTFANEIEAEIARAVLEAHGIPARVMHDDASGMLLFVHGAPLSVRREDADLALDVLDAPIEELESADDDEDAYDPGE